MSPSNAVAAAPPSWAQFLDGVAESLEQTLTAVAEAPEPEVVPSAMPAPGVESLARVGQRLEQIEASVRRAEELAAELDARCDAGLAVAGRLLERLLAVRQKLAAKGRRGV